MALQTAALIIGSGCAVRAQPGDVPGSTPVAGAPYQNAHLLDGAAEKMLGRLVEPGQYPVEPRDSVRTECSAYLEVLDNQPVERGQSIFSGTARALKQRRARKAGDDIRAMYIDYTGDTASVAAITDPQALRKCGNRSADYCTEYYIGELVEGIGRSFSHHRDPEIRHPQRVCVKTTTGDLGSLLKGARAWA